jgi:hypothetical protein
MNNFNFSVDETEGPSDAEQQMSLAQLQARNAQDTIELERERMRREMTLAEQAAFENRTSRTLGFKVH